MRLVAAHVGPSHIVFAGKVAVDPAHGESRLGYQYNMNQTPT